MVFVMAIHHVSHLQQSAPCVFRRKRGNISRKQSEASILRCILPKEAAHTSVITFTIKLH